MKIVSWNCNGAFRKKYPLVEALQADIYVIQECEDPRQCKEPHYAEWAGNYLWTGLNKHKGLGVFVKHGHQLQALELEAGGLELFLPCTVNDTRLLAVWTREANSPTFKYIGQLYKYLQLHQQHFTTAKSLIVGDLNSNACWDVWDRWWNHSDVAKQLADAGLSSLYHQLSGEDQGNESSATFFMQRKLGKPYHIDYIFLSQALLQAATLKVGQPQQWLQHSDHMPLIATFG